MAARRPRKLPFPPALAVWLRAVPRFWGLGGRADKQTVGGAVGFTGTASWFSCLFPPFVSLSRPHSTKAVTHFTTHENACTARLSTWDGERHPERDRRCRPWISRRRRPRVCRVGTHPLFLRSSLLLFLTAHVPAGHTT